MGASQASYKNNDHNLVNSSLHEMKKVKINHERFRDCEVNPSDEQITTKIIFDFSKFQYDYWVKNIALIQQNASSDMLFLPKKYELQKPLFTCGSTEHIKLTFENYPYILQQQIYNRSINNPPQYLQEAQLWILLYTLVKCQNAFSNLSLKVGDIHPHNIFINAEGYPKLACQFSWPNEKSNFQKMYYDKLPRYLSPQEMKLCEQGSDPDICYVNTSEAFSIGLTMLGAGILQNLDRICDIRTFKFNKKYFQICLNRWMDLKFKHTETQQIIKYSEQLKDIVRNLCHLNVSQRYLVSTIYEILKPYQKEIINLKKFKINNYFDLIRRNKSQNEKSHLISKHPQVDVKKYQIPNRELPLIQNSIPIKQINRAQQLNLQTKPENQNYYFQHFQKYSTLNTQGNNIQLNPVKKIHSNVSFNQNLYKLEKNLNSIDKIPNIKFTSSTLQPQKTLISHIQIKKQHIYSISSKPQNITYPTKNSNQKNIQQKFTMNENLIKEFPKESAPIEQTKIISLEQQRKQFLRKFQEKIKNSQKNY